ncbi:unnamed protein product [Pleuronectes platessa]|uniref:Uncharacterized protein n=1 Tax=Pleuronectes platessa TaxID=8262 RepID=A0A9N7Z9P8_PLEPL|nr:unnamed protein product [Pleuronectes platessa]
MRRAPESHQPMMGQGWELAPCSAGAGVARLGDKESVLTDLPIKDILLSQANKPPGFWIVPTSEGKGGDGSQGMSLVGNQWATDKQPCWLMLPVYSSKGQVSAGTALFVVNTKKSEKGKESSKTEHGEHPVKAGAF